MTFPGQILLSPGNEGSSREMLPGKESGQTVIPAQAGMKFCFKRI